MDEHEFAKKRPFDKNIPSGKAALSHKFDPPGDPIENNDWVLVLGVSKNKGAK